MENVLSTDELLRQIEALKEENEELKREKTQQRYGLIWEDSPEKLDDPNIVPLLLGDPDEYVKRFVDNEPLNKDILMDEEKPMNYLIEGDNYHSLKALERTHTGKIDVIYIDPPYNTGNEFVYNDKIVDKEDSYRHSKWLSFMSKRLEIARRLMSDDGVIFVSIDDNEQAQLKLLMDSIFGESNHMTTFIWENIKSPSNLSKIVRKNTEYILTYSKNRNKVEGFVKEIKEKKDDFSLYNRNNIERVWKIPKEHIQTGLDDGIYKESTGENVKLVKEVEVRDGKFMSDLIIKSRFTLTEETMLHRLQHNEMYIKVNSETFTPRGVGINKFTTVRPTTLLDGGEYGTTLQSSNEMREIFGATLFDYTKPVKLIKGLIRFMNKKDITVLDFFAGSGTTGHAVLELNKEDGGNRQFILCTNNEVSEEKVRNHFYEQGLIPKPNKTEFNKFKKENPDLVLDFTKSDEYQELGIARSVTYERLRRVIEGYTTPKGKEVEGIPANLMYLTTKEYTKDEVRDVRESGRFGKTTEMYAGLMYLKYPRTTHTVMFITDEVGFSNFEGIDTLPTENVVIVLSGLDYPHEIANIIRKEVKTKNLIFEYLKY